MKDIAILNLNDMETVHNTIAEAVGEAPLNPYVRVDVFDVRYVWDSTLLESLKRCPRLYHYTSEGWVTKQDNVNLRFGGELHQAFQEYEVLVAQQVSHDDAVFEVVKQLLLRTDDWNSTDKYKNRRSLVRTVVWYLDSHKNDTAKTVILAGGKPAVEVSFRFELDYGPTPEQPYVICGHLDKIVEFNGDLFDMDHKTTTTVNARYFDQFDPHNQMSLYTLASQIIFEAPIKGVIINAAEIKVDYTRFERGITYRTESQLEEWLVDLKYTLQSAERYAADGYWPMNDTACDKYGGCKFREVCSKAPGVRQRFLQSNFDKVEPWNPLKPR